MKREIIAIAFLIVAISTSLFADYKTKSICDSLKIDFRGLYDNADRLKPEEIKSKTETLSDKLDRDKKLLYILSDHTNVEKIEVGISKAYAVADTEEIKSIYMECIDELDRISQSCSPYIWNIF